MGARAWRRAKCQARAVKDSQPFSIPSRLVLELSVLPGGSSKSIGSGEGKASPVEPASTGLILTWRPCHRLAFPWAAERWSRLLPLLAMALSHHAWCPQVPHSLTWHTSSLCSAPFHTWLQCPDPAGPGRPHSPQAFLDPVGTYSYCPYVLGICEGRTGLLFVVVASELGGMLGLQ
jgi:hypothetical protein